MSDLARNSNRQIARNQALIGAGKVRGLSRKPQIKAMIRDDLAEAIAAGEIERVMRLKLALRHFCATHPDLRACRSK